MPRGHLRMDLSVVRQGLHLAREFGLRPLEELARVAELVEHSVYEAGSLRSGEDEIRFTLLNPPLRMGAFSRIGLAWDGVPIPPDRAWIRLPGAPGPSALSLVTVSSPVTIPIGERTEFGFSIAPVPAGAHAVRLELQSVAVPPLVWFDFTDHVAGTV